MKSSNGRTARSWSMYDVCWMMTHCRRSTGHLHSHWQSISRTALQHTSWLIRLRTRPRRWRSHFWNITVCSGAWLSCTFWTRNERSWITEPLPAYSLGTAYWLSSTSYTIHWPRRFTTPEMWYSEKDSGTPHRMLQMKRFCTSTSTEMSSRCRNPHPPRKNLKPHSQRRMKIPNVKQRSHWTTIHLQSQSRSHGNWLALRRHLQMHGSRLPKELIGTVLARTSWLSLHNWLLKMRNSKIWFPSMLQLPSPMIRKMEFTIQSLTNQQPSRRSPRNGIWWWMNS